MGLFGRKKKPTKEEAAAADAAAHKAAADHAAAVKAAQDAAAREVADRADAERKRAADQEKAKEEKILADIARKRKDIKQLENALNGFEEQRRREAAAAVGARKANKMAEAKAHLRNATRLKNRIAQYENQVVLAQSQLDALEDAAFQRQGLQANKAFTENMGTMKIDTEDVDNVLQDMREAMSGVNDVNLTLQADAKLNQGLYDADDAMAELDALEAEYAGQAADAIPSVPGEVPAMPAAAPPVPAKAPPPVTLNESEEEEMRRLEADVAL